METLLKLLLVIPIVLMLTGCPGPEIIISESPPYAFTLNADFNTTFYKSMLWEDGYAGLKGPVCQLIQKGSGMDEEIGNFRIELVCCWSSVDGTPGSSGGYITDGHGGTLYIECEEELSGSGFPSDYPNNQTVINGKIQFTGGTGRFEGATGDGVMACTVNTGVSEATMAHHWEGSIKCIKED